MRKFRQVWEYRLTKKISAEQTALALMISKSSVINIVHRFEESALIWPLPQDFTDTESLILVRPSDCKSTHPSSFSFFDIQDSLFDIRNFSFPPLIINNTE